MNKENLIHVRLEYGEALESKKDVLSSEINIIKILKAVKKYHSLREDEIALKTKLYKNIKNLIIKIKKIQSTLPKPKIPGILKPAKEVEKKPKKKIAEEEGLEAQLRKIEEKLASIS